MRVLEVGAESVTPPNRFTHSGRDRPLPSVDTVESGDKKVIGPISCLFDSVYP